MLRIETYTNGRPGSATVPGWAMGLVGVACLGIGLVVLTIGAGLALLLAPVVAGAFFIARWRLRKALREAGVNPARRAPAGVIDADYRVIDGDSPR